MESKQHFEAMEKNYQELDQATQKFTEQLETFRYYQTHIEKLAEYYGSNEWYEHREMETEGLLQEYPTTAVLGEDYPYDTLLQLREDAFNMLEIATTILKTI